jgi:hypothetical protein
MAATQAQIDDLRGMIAEPTDDTYADADLATVIEAFPLVDAMERQPNESVWIATYDLNAAAHKLWARKAASLANLYDFTADGGTFSRNQAFKNAQSMARYYGSMRAPFSLRVHIDRNYERDYQSNPLVTPLHTSEDSSMSVGQTGLPPGVSPVNGPDPEWDGS